MKMGNIASALPEGLQQIPPGSAHFLFLQQATVLHVTGVP